jgi:hypothetical protein
MLLTLHLEPFMARKKKKLYLPHQDDKIKIGVIVQNGSLWLLFDPA